MTTPLKIILSVVSFIVCSIIIALMKEAHMFGKTFIVFVLLFILRFIWAKSNNVTPKINNQNTASQQNLSAQQNNSVINNAQQHNVNSIQSNIIYNGGHNSSGSTNQNNIVQPSVPLSPPSSKKRGEFEGTNPYAEN